MKLKQEISRAPADVLNTAEVLVDYARNPQHLLDLAHSVWPKLSVCKGQTHWTFTPADGQYFAVLMP